MANLIEMYLEELYEREQTVSEKRKLVEGETRKFSEEVARILKDIDVQQNRINTIAKTPIRASVNSIIGVLADKWSVSASDIDVSMKTNFDATTFVKPSMERAKEIIETSVENYHNMYITISKKPEADPFLHHTFLVPIRLEHKHADGKTMREHIVPKISDASDRENYNIFFGIDDINSIIIEYKLRELIKSSRNGFVANDDKAKALLEAFEFERNNKEQDMEMSN